MLTKQFLTFCFSSGFPSELDSQQWNLVAWVQKPLRFDALTIHRDRLCNIQVGNLYLSSNKRKRTWMRETERVAFSILPCHENLHKFWNDLRKFRRERFSARSASQIQRKCKSYPSLECKWADLSAFSSRSNDFGIKPNSFRSFLASPALINTEFDKLR